MVRTEQTDPTNGPSHSDAHQRAWEDTLEEMNALADQRRMEGWNVDTVQAGHTAPTGREAGDDTRFGLFYVVPKSGVDAFKDAAANGDWPEHEVYQREVEGRVFIVTEFRDPSIGHAIFLAGNFTTGDAAPLVKDVFEAGKTFTHIHSLDTTHICSFSHNDPAVFFPDPGLYGVNVDN